MARILHISDTHAFSQGVSDALALKEYVNPDIAVCSGDMVQDYYEQSVSSDLLSSFACTIGNHDAILKAGTDPNGYHWDMQPTAAQEYEKFIKPSNEPIDKVNGHSYWSADISDSITVIGLNDTALNDELSAQNTWLTDKLQRCSDEARKVIIASHYFPSTASVKKDATFTCKKYYKNYTNNVELNSQYPAILDIQTRLQEHKDLLLFSMHGHEHADAVGFSNYNNHVIIGSTLIDSYNDVIRSNDAYTSRTVANVYEISDDNPRYLTIYRLGANICATGIIRSMIAIDLQAHEVVSCYSL